MGTGKRVTFNVADDDNVAIDSLIGNPKITLTTSDENAGKIGNQLFSDRKSRRTKKSFRGTYLNYYFSYDVCACFRLSVCLSVFLQKKTF